MIDDATLDNFARQAYRAYGEVTEFKNYQGLPMPGWGDLSDTIQDAWRAAARQVATAAIAWEELLHDAKVAYQVSAREPE